MIMVKQMFGGGGVFSSSLQGARVNICLTMFYFGGILNKAPGQLEESR